MSLPDATPQPCSDCPWRRNAAPGWLGPHSPDEWILIAMGEGPIACHQTIVTEDGKDEGAWDHPQVRQCRGGASFRHHICKVPRNPEVVTGPENALVFKAPQEFLDHHKPLYERYYEPHVKKEERRDA